MERKIIEGSSKRKIFILLYHLRDLYFPLKEYINLILPGIYLNGPKIVKIQIKFVELSGKEEIIYFDENDLNNIKNMTELQNQLVSMEDSHQEIIEQIRKMKSEVLTKI
jgi:hypothetical protein